MRDSCPEAERLAVALELHEAGVAMMRHKLVREHPELGPDGIEALLASWLCERPGARHGDAPGRLVPWPREAS